jgi:tetraacyldisaccharide 4'-kinase
MPRFEQFHRGVIDGSRTGAGAAVLRGALAVAEPLYTGVTSIRNALFTNGYIASAQAARPVVSVGNITTGGTGKTPVVHWLCEALGGRGYRPAVLMRGYKAAAGECGDEQRLLQSHLPEVIVHANPSRTRGSAEVLATSPHVNVFILDDGFQHRKLRRDFDLVLIDATNPFGFDHVLPRGLLRESVAGLARASAILLTHAESIEPAALQQVTQRIRRIAPGAPVYRCEHQLTHVLDQDDRPLPLEHIRGRRVLSFCGIGNPAAFERQILQAGANVVAAHRFGDHHPYTADDLNMLDALARQKNAEMMLTTGKDWVKLRELHRTSGSASIARMEMSIRFADGDEHGLIEKILTAVEQSPAQK